MKTDPTRIYFGHERRNIVQPQRHRDLFRIGANEYGSGKPKNTMCLSHPRTRRFAGNEGCGARGKSVLIIPASLKVFPVPTPLFLALDPDLSSQFSGPSSLAKRHPSPLVPFKRSPSRSCHTRSACSWSAYSDSASSYAFRVRILISCSRQTVRAPDTSDSS